MGNGTRREERERPADGGLSRFRSIQRMVLILCQMTQFYGVHRIPDEHKRARFFHWAGI